MNNPKPGEWRADELSQNYIADYKPFNFVDGEGVRCSLYVSGCMFIARAAIIKPLGHFVMERLILKSLKIKLWLTLLSLMSKV